MLANYGYKDGSGEYFITIDTDRCAACTDRGCIQACPVQVLEIIIDDYEQEVASVAAEHRKKLKFSCASCKPNVGRSELPCMAACEPKAISHSW